MLRSSIGDTESAIDFTKQSLEINETISNILGKGVNLHQLGKIYTDQGRYPEARMSFEEAIEIKREYVSLHTEATSLHQYGKLEKNREIY